LSACHRQAATLAATDGSGIGPIPAGVLQAAKLEAARDAGGGRLAALAADGDPIVRARAMLALGRLGGSSSVGSLVQGLGDSETAVRVAAATAIGLTGDPSVIDGLTAKVAAEKDPSVRAAEAFALGMAGDGRGVQPLVGLLGDPSALVRQGAARALGALSIRGIDIGPAAAGLAAALGDTDAPTRWSSAWAVLESRLPGGNQGDPLDAALAKAVDGDADMTVRAMALRALATRDPGNAANLSRFQTAAGASDWRVEVEAGEAVAAAGTAGGDLLAKLADSEWSAVSAAEETLTGPELHVLIAWLRDLWPYAARPAVAALLKKLLYLSDVSDAAVDYRPLVLRGIALANCAASALSTVGGAHGIMEKCGGSSEEAVASWQKKQWEAAALAYVGKAAPSAFDYDGQRHRFLPPPLGAAESFVQAPLADPADLWGHNVNLLVVTEKGDFTIALDPVDQTQTALALVHLAQAGKLHGLPIADAVPDYGVVIGDPLGGRQIIPAERSAVSFERGTVGLVAQADESEMELMGNGAELDLFVCTSPAPELDGRATAVGQVTDGMDVVDMLEPGDVIKDVYAKVAPP
jgi:peptidylprolyl isomerase